MKWLWLIFLVVSGYRAPDARYERACERLERTTRGHVTCELLEQLAAARQEAQETEVEPGTKVGEPRTGISNGF